MAEACFLCRSRWWGDHGTCRIDEAMVPELRLINAVSDKALLVGEALRASSGSVVLTRRQRVAKKLV